jgi:hypothetical protein
MGNKCGPPAFAPVTSFGTSVNLRLSLSNVLSRGFDQFAILNVVNGFYFRPPCPNRKVRDHLAKAPVWVESTHLPQNGKQFLVVRSAHIALIAERSASGAPDG